jgi:polyisoprenoid-binding protein YceI
MVELWEASPPESEIRFTLQHLVLSEITGIARRWQAVIGIDRSRPERSAVEVVIAADSVETGSPARDEQLHSAEFLDVDNFPEIRFQSTEVRSDSDGGFVIVGDLQVKDVTREVVLAGAYEGEGPNARLVFTARTMVDRQEMRLHWNQDLDHGGVVVGDKVALEIRLAAKRFEEGLRSGAPTQAW